MLWTVTVEYLDGKIDEFEVEALYQIHDLIHQGVLPKKKDEDVRKISVKPKIRRLKNA